MLGSVFEYPQILEEPTSDILALFREHQGAVMGWFLVLVVSAALMAPAGICSAASPAAPSAGGSPASASPRRPSRSIGLQRWVTLVPGISDDALDPARRAAPRTASSCWHTLLGKVIGETIGYALTATFTVLVVIALRRTVLPGWLALVGVRRRGPDRHRRRHPRRRGRQPDQLRRLRAWCAWLLAVGFLLLRVRDPRSLSVPSKG